MPLPKWLLLKLNTEMARNGTKSLKISQLGVKPLLAILVFSFSCSHSGNGTKWLQISQLGMKPLLAN